MVYYNKVNTICRVQVNRPSFQDFAQREQVQNPIASTLLPEAILSFPLSSEQLDYSVLRHLFDKVRSSGRLEVDHLHYIRTSEEC